MTDDRPPATLEGYSPYRSARGVRRLDRTRLRWLRRLAGYALLLAPSAWILGGDLVRRGSLIIAFDRPHLWAYLGGCVQSVVFWSVLLHVAARRRRALGAVAAVLFVVLFSLAAGIEAGFHAFYNIYLSMDGQIHSKSIPWSILGHLPFNRMEVAVPVGLAVVVAVALVLLARKAMRPRPIARLLTPFLAMAALVATTQIPVSYRTLQSTPPDMIYFHGITAVVKEHLDITHDSPDLRVQRRRPEWVPPLTPRPARPRNVLLILQESQRADVTCVEYDPDCPLATPFSNSEAPRRLPLLQLRANDSTTAISISNIWSGVRPTEGRELLHSVPLLWDYAHAAGYDTAYWTSQNLMFGNARLYVQDIPARFRCVATELESQADLDCGAEDALVTDRAIRDWRQLEEPFFAVVHYSNVHWPYVYDEDHAPFQPSELNKDADKNEHFKNYYKNVVYLSDIAVGRLIEHVRSTDKGQRTVILYTADHGESFREHWQLGHTSAIYDEEILVPGWIDAPPGTLSPDEEATIASARDDFLWHLDLAPTMLDLMGVWDEPALSPFRARMMGHPITRPERTVEPVPLTNCTWVWECAFRNWGLMQGPMKIEAREWDGEFHCFNVLEDPEELENLGETACAPLPDIARQLYHVMPNVTPPGRPRVDWGSK